MAATYVYLVGMFREFDNITSAGGHVIIEPQTTVRDSTSGNVLLEPKAMKRKIVDGAMVPARVVASDSDNITPSAGLTYKISIVINTLAAPVPWLLVVPKSTAINPATDRRELDLATAVPLATPPAISFPAVDPAVAAAIAAGDALNIPLAQKAAPSGVATLDSGGHVPVGQLPAIAIGETFVVNSQVAMLALTAQRGDVAQRTDLTPTRLFLLATDDPTQLANWIEITAAGAVTSVNGRAGVVTGLQEGIPTGTYAQALVATAVTAANYTAAPKDYALMDATAASRVVTLPTAPADLSRIGVKMVATTSPNTVTINCGGSDHFNLPTGATAATLTLLNQAVILQYVAATATWTAQADDLPLSQLDARYAKSGVQPYTAITAGNAKTPTQLNIRAVSRTRQIDPMPADKFVITEDGFGTGTVGLVTISGTATQAQANSQLQVSTAGSLLNRVYTVPARAAAPYWYIRCRIEDCPGTVEVGLVRDAPRRYITVLYVNGAGEKTIKIRVPDASPGTVYTLDASLLPTPPFDLIIMIAHPQALYFIDRGSGLEHIAGASGAVAVGGWGVDIRDTAEVKAWNPYLKVDPALNSMVKLSNFRAGYLGPLGFREATLATFKDGTPLIHEDKYVLTATILNVDSYLGSNTAVLLLDPDTYEVELIGHIYATANGKRTSLVSGQMVYDPDTDEFILIYGEVGLNPLIGSLGVQGSMWKAVTRKDMLARNKVHLLTFTAMTPTGATSKSVWDPAFRWDATAGLWYVAATEADVAGTSWTKMYPILLSGPTLDTLTVAQRRTDIQKAEGAHWAKIGNVWYILYGTYSGGISSGGFWAYDATLSNPIALPTWQNASGLGISWGGTFPRHPCLVPVCDATSTRYLLVTWDNVEMPYAGSAYAASTGTTIGTQGSLVVMEADEVVVGAEFARRTLVRG